MTDDMTNIWSQIAEHIATASARSFSAAPPRQIGGGCINAAVVLQHARDRDRAYFVKLNTADLLPMFEAEAAGLAALGAAGALRVPSPLCSGVADGRAFLVMERIPFGRQRDEAAAGRALAKLHRVTQPLFGWHRDNWIGSTPQSNRPDENWPRFWHDRRLGSQLDLARRNGYGGRLQERGARLLERLPALLAHAPAPALLHGDLWSGNIGYDPAGVPVIFDPAVYYGDREADLAMTELFGGFGLDFYAAYREAWPLDAGYRVRKDLYNLYHILNHLNLFGRGYLDQALTLTDRLLAESS